MIYEYVEIGRFKKSTGLSGEIFVEINDLFHDDISKVQALFHLHQGTYVPYLVEDLDLDEAVVRVKLEGVDKPEEAAQLSGNACYLRTIDISGNSLLGDQHPLIGYAIYSNGASYGIIAEVQHYPQGEMAVVQWGERSWMFPLVDAFVLAINELSQKLEISFPEGYEETFILPDKF